MSNANTDDHGLVFGDYPTYQAYLSAYRVLICTAGGCREHQKPAAEWEWLLLSGTAANGRVGTRLTVETHDREHIVVDHVQPESILWLAINHAPGHGATGLGPLALSMETEDERIVNVPNVRQWWTETITY